MLSTLYIFCKNFHQMSVSSAGDFLPIRHLMIRHLVRLLNGLNLIIFTRNIVYGHNLRYFKNPPSLFWRLCMLREVATLQYLYCPIYRLTGHPSRTLNSLNDVAVIYQQSMSTISAFTPVKSLVGLYCYSLYM